MRAVEDFLIMLTLIHQSSSHAVNLSTASCIRYAAVVAYSYIMTMLADWEERYCARPVKTFIANKKH